MPLYVCNAKKNAIPEDAKPLIAKDVTRIHCDVTGAPATFVHVFFFEDAPHQPLGENTAFLFGSIRAGRTEAQRQQIHQEMRDAICNRAEIPSEEILVHTVDVPASWVMEGGDLLPEPGEEEAWLAAHEAKMAEANAG